MLSHMRKIVSWHRPTVWAARYSDQNLQTHWPSADRTWISCVTLGKLPNLQFTVKWENRGPFGNISLCSPITFLKITKSLRALILEQWNYDMVQTTGYSLGYDPLLSLLFCCSDCSSFSHRELFQVNPVSFNHTSIIHSFIHSSSTSLLSSTTRYSRLTLYVFPASTPESTISLRGLGPFKSENSIQKPWSGC